MAISCCDDLGVDTDHPASEYFECRDGGPGWPWLYYRADWMRWCPQIPLATDWCSGNHSAFRHNGGYAVPILDEAA